MLRLAYRRASKSLPSILKRTNSSQMNPTPPSAVPDDEPFPEMPVNLNTLFNKVHRLNKTMDRLWFEQRLLSEKATAGLKSAEHKLLWKLVTILGGLLIFQDYSRNWEESPSKLILKQMQSHGMPFDKPTEVEVKETKK